ncbi:MAG: prepilin-type N-terminal cleavage/methylation domain-containing protein, partial [Planctomycetota bacterium]
MVGPARRRPTAGFTFIEVMVVMAVMAVLMGLGVGYLQSIGRTSRVAQARAILRETAYACKQASNGGARAIFDLRMVDRPDGGQVLTVGAAVSQPVLTHHFESLETASLDYPLSIEGTVESEPAGYIGRAARFVGTGWIEFAPQASFAMTDGIDVDVRLKPEPGRARMMVLRGEGAYELELVRGRDTSGYEVALTLWLRDDSRGGRSPAERAPPFTTDAAPVKPGVWNHVQVRYDGHDVSLRVNDI